MMAFNGTGTFSLETGNPVATGTVISSTVHNNTMSDIANNGLSNCITKDGQTTITQNIPLNNKKITNLGAATLVSDAVRVDQVQSGELINLTSVSGSNTITAVLSPSIAYATGQTFILVPAVVNTAGVTLNINSLGARDVYYNGAALRPGFLLVGQPVFVRYDGTRFNMIETPKPERGSNANGEYVKFADGTQVCTGRSSSSDTADVPWVFPAAFISASQIGLSISAITSNVTPIVSYAQASLSVTGVDYRAYSPAGSRLLIGVSMTAIGRWF